MRRPQEIEGVNQRLPEMIPPMNREQMDSKPLEYPIQFVCHIVEDDKLPKFIAFDSFNSHHFTTKKVFDGGDQKL
jgi:hypothetical protein